MKNKLKKVLSLILALCMAFGVCLSVISVGKFKASAEEQEEPEEFVNGVFTYIVEDDAAIIKNIDASTFGDLVIPDTLDGYIVKGLEIVFVLIPELTSILISSSVSSVIFENFYAPKLKSIAVDSNNEFFSSLNGNLYNKDKTVLVRFCTDKDTVFVLPETVKVISPFAFSGVTEFYNIRLHAGKTFVPDTLDDFIINYFDGLDGMFGNEVIDALKSELEDVDELINTIRDSAESAKRYLAGETIAANELPGSLFDEDPIFFSVLEMKMVFGILNLEVCVEKAPSWFIDLSNDLRVLQEYAFASTYYDKETFVIDDVSYVKGTINYTEYTEYFLEMYEVYYFGNDKIFENFANELDAEYESFVSSYYNSGEMSYDQAKTAALENFAHAHDLELVESDKDYFDIYYLIRHKVCLVDFGKYVGISINEDAVNNIKNNDEMNSFLASIGLILYSNNSLDSIDMFGNCIRACFKACVTQYDTDEALLNIALLELLFIISGRDYTILEECDGSHIDPSDKIETIVDLLTGIEFDYPVNKYEGSISIKINLASEGESILSVVDTSLDVTNGKVFSIKMTQDGKEIQTNGAVRIKIPVPDGYDISRTYVVYIDPVTKTVQNMRAIYEDGFMVFETNHFSYYAIIESENYHPDDDLIKINNDNINLYYKGSAKVDCEYSNVNIVYISSDTSVATVDENGNIKAVGKGTATITATIEGTDISATCTVVVSYAWWQQIIRILLLGFLWY